MAAASHNYLTFFKYSTSSSTSVSSLCCREFFMQTFKWLAMTLVQTPCSAPDIDDIWRRISMHCSSSSIILCIPRTCPSIRLRRRHSCFFSLSLLQCGAFFLFFIIPYTPIPYNACVKLFLCRAFFCAVFLKKRAQMDSHLRYFSLFCFAYYSESDIVMCLIYFCRLVSFFRAAIHYF